MKLFPNTWFRTTVPEDNALLHALVCGAAGLDPISTLVFVIQNSDEYEEYLPSGDAERPYFYYVAGFVSGYGPVVRLDMSAPDRLYNAHRL